MSERVQIAQLRALLALKLFDPPPPPAPGNDVVVSVPFSFATPSPTVIGAVSAGRIMNRSIVLIETAFDGTAPTVSFGTTTDPSLFLGSSDVSATRAGQYESDELVVLPTSDILILTISAFAATMGSGVLFFKVSG